MAKTYTVASEEGAERYGAEIGDKVQLDLAGDEERALVAAGWLALEKKAKEAKT